MEPASKGLGDEVEILSPAEAGGDEAHTASGRCPAPSFTARHPPKELYIQIEPQGFL
jgi:hypothetical protein